MVGVVYLAILLGLSVALLLANDWLRRFLWCRRNPPEKLAAERAHYLARVASPDWAYFEEHLQRPVPAALRGAFASKEFVAKSFQFGDYYVTFEPIDRSVSPADNWVLPGVFSFADSDGDPIFLRAGPLENNAVHIAYHDGGGTGQLSPSVEEFLSRLRAGA
jgi:hypothetical protein